MTINLDLQTIYMVVIFIVCVVIAKLMLTLSTTSYQDTSNDEEKLQKIIDSIKLKEEKLKDLKLSQRDVEEEILNSKFSLNIGNKRKLKSINNDIAKLTINIEETRKRGNELYEELLEKQQIAKTKRREARIKKRDSLRAKKSFGILVKRYFILLAIIVLSYLAYHFGLIEKLQSLNSTK